MAIYDKFNFILFKNAMQASDQAEATYSIILRAVFQELKTLYSIDIEEFAEIPDDLVYAIFRHTKYLYDIQENSVDVMGYISSSDSNRVNFSPEFPKEVLNTYRQYSQTAPAIRVDNDNIGV